MSEVALTPEEKAAAAQASAAKNGSENCRLISDYAPPLRQ